MLGLVCLLARWRLALSAAAAVDLWLIAAILVLAPRRDVQRYGQKRGGELIPLRARETTCIDAGTPSLLH